MEKPSRPKVRNTATILTQTVTIAPERSTQWRCQSITRCLLSTSRRLLSGSMRRSGDWNRSITSLDAHVYVPIFNGVVCRLPDQGLATHMRQGAVAAWVWMDPLCSRLPAHHTQQISAHWMLTICRNSVELALVRSMTVSCGRRSEPKRYRPHTRSVKNAKGHRGAPVRCTAAPSAQQPEVREAIIGSAATAPRTVTPIRSSYSNRSTHDCSTQLRSYVFQTTNRLLPRLASRPRSRPLHGPVGEVAQ